MDWNDEMDAAFSEFLRTDPECQQVINEIKQAAERLRKRDNLPRHLPYHIVVHDHYCWLQITDEKGASHVINVRA